MRIPLILFSFVLIECSVGAPTSGCSSELEDYKELVNAKASIKSSLITALLEQVNAIDIQTKDGDTLLMMAARNGLSDVVYELLNLNATITVSKDTITAASKLANEAGFQEVVEIFRNATLKFDGGNVDETDGDMASNITAQLDGSKANEKDEDGNTALHRAAKEGHTKVVEFLLKTPGIDVNALDTEFRGTPLNWAAEGGHTEVVELLLKTPGIDVNVRDNHGRNPLNMADYYGHHEIVRMLKAAWAVE